MIPLRVLIVEDSEADAVLVERELRRAGYSPECRRVDSADRMEAALNEGQWDVVLCDYQVPGFGALSSLAALRRRELDIPCIVVSGKMGEEVAVEVIEAGAHDFVMKGGLQRLGKAVKRELADAENRRERRKAEQALVASEAELRALANRLLHSKRKSAVA